MSPPLDAGHIARSHVADAIYHEVVDADGAIAAVCSWIYDNSLTKTAEDDRLILRTAYATATSERAPKARQCVDPFHVVKLANEAIDRTRRWAWNLARASEDTPARWVKRTRWALLKDPADLTPTQRDVLAELKASGGVLWRAYLLKEALRKLYHHVLSQRARRYLEQWLAWACRGRIPAMVQLSRTIRANREGILAANRGGCPVRRRTLGGPLSHQAAILDDVTSFVCRSIARASSHRSR